MATKLSPTRSAIHIAAAVLRTLRSTLRAARSMSVQRPAMLVQRVVVVGRRALGEGGGDEALQHEIAVAAVGGGAVGVGGGAQAEVAAVGAAVEPALQHVLARARAS